MSKTTQNTYILQENLNKIQVLINDALSVTKHDLYREIAEKAIQISENEDFSIGLKKIVTLLNESYLEEHQTPMRVEKALWGETSCMFDQDIFDLHVVYYSLVIDKYLDFLDSAKVALANLAKESDYQQKENALNDFTADIIAVFSVYGDYKHGEKSTWYVWSNTYREFLKGRNAQRIYLLAQLDNLVELLLKKEESCQ